MDKRNCVIFSPSGAPLRMTLLLVAIIMLCRATASEYCLDGTSMVLVDQEKQLCCEGLYDRMIPHGLQQECCRKIENGTLEKSQVYVKQKKICCGGELHDIPKHRRHPEPKCCGVDFISSISSSFCCNNKVYQISEKFAYCDNDNDLEVVVGLNEKACKQVTPNGTVVKVHKLRTGYECCGTNLFNENTQSCQGEEIWPLEAVVSECGNEGLQYDKNVNICCESGDKGTFQLKPKPGPGFIKAKYLGIEPDIDCLDGEIVDKDVEHIVQSGNKKRVVPHNFLPCNGENFDPNNKRTQVDCCNGVVNHAKPGMNVTCCGPEFIDTDVYQCCNNVKIGATKLCCGNEIYERTSGLECCGNQLINNSYLCCKPQTSISIPVRKKPGHNSCCGNQTFYNDPQGKDKCCGGKVIALEQNQDCVRDHIVPINPANPEEVKGQVKNLTSDREENLEAKRRGITDNHACPSCYTFKEPQKKCVKKFEYEVYIREIRKKGTNTVMEVLFLEPSILRKVKMDFRTKGHCRCFKQDEIYLLQTNRNIQAKVKSGNMKLRFSKKDIFHLMGKFPQFRVSQKCTIDRYYRRPIVP